MVKSKLPCYYSIHGVNYKNGMATSCPTQSDSLHLRDGRLPSEFWNDEGFRKHRLSLYNGEWDVPGATVGCNLCKTMEADGLTSMRYDKRQVEGPNGEEMDMYREEYLNTETGEVDFKALEHIELRFNNSCNMACLHCDHVFSSGWETKLKNYKPDWRDRMLAIAQLLKHRHQPLASPKLDRIKISIEETKNIIKDLCKNFPNINQYDCSGGEPLKQKQFFVSLEEFRKHPNADNITIFFYTNFNADFDVNHLNELLSPFRKVIINISIDAGKNIYPYFRDGNWETLKDNLKKFRAINNNSFIKGIITYSVYQILDIYDVFTSIETLPIDLLDVAPVQTPPYLNPSLAIRGSNELYIADDIDKTYDNIKWESSKLGLAKIEDYIYNTKTSRFDWEGFIHYTNRMKRLWGKDFNKHFPNYQITEEKHGSGKLIRRNS